jgi:YfiR/HmsC-like
MKRARTTSRGRQHGPVKPGTRPWLYRLGRALALSMLAALPATAQLVDEYQMKAAYVYNLAKFVEWPAAAFKTAGDPITICVLGQSPIVESLNAAVKEEMIDERKLVVRPISDIHEAVGCQILFIGSSERKQTESALRNLATSGVLTGGETPGFAAEGGVVNFTLDHKRVRIQINLGAAKQQRLRISPELLSLATIVQG